MFYKKIGIKISLFIILFFGFMLITNATEATCQYDFKYRAGDANGDTIEDEHTGYIKVYYKGDVFKVTYDLDSKFSTSYNFSREDFGNSVKMSCPKKMYYALAFIINGREAVSTYKFSLNEIKDDGTFGNIALTGSSDLNEAKSKVINDGKYDSEYTTRCDYVTDNLAVYPTGNPSRVTLLFNDTELKVEIPGCTNISKYTIDLDYIKNIGKKCPEGIAANAYLSTACWIDVCPGGQHECVKMKLTTVEGENNNGGLIGSQYTHNGKKCTITSNKENTCRIDGYTRFEAKNNLPVCTNSRGESKKINRTSDNFDNTFDDGTKVCSENYMMVGEYCYECREGGAISHETVDCSIFREITTPVWLIIRIIAPILALVLGAMDFLKATAASDEKEMKKATSSFVKRLIMLAVLFLLTFIVNLIVGLVGFGGIDACL